MQELDKAQSQVLHLLPFSLNAQNRRLREFTPEEKKDQVYWAKRRKNNEAAKRSREKRRLNCLVLSHQVLKLATENKKLKKELVVVKGKLSAVVEGKGEASEKKCHEAVGKKAAKEDAFDEDDATLENLQQNPKNFNEILNITKKLCSDICLSPEKNFPENVMSDGSNNAEDSLGVCAGGSLHKKAKCSKDENADEATAVCLDHCDKKKCPASENSKRISEEARVTELKGQVVKNRKGSLKERILRSESNQRGINYAEGPTALNIPALAAATPASPSQSTHLHAPFLECTTLHDLDSPLHARPQGLLPSLLIDAFDENNDNHDFPAPNDEQNIVNNSGMRDKSGDAMRDVTRDSTNKISRSDLDEAMNNKSTSIDGNKRLGNHAPIESHNNTHHCQLSDETNAAHKMSQSFNPGLLSTKSLLPFSPNDGAISFPTLSYANFRNSFDHSAYHTNQNTNHMKNFTNVDTFALSASKALGQGMATSVARDLYSAYQTPLMLPDHSLLIGPFPKPYFSISSMYLDSIKFESGDVLHERPLNLCTKEPSAVLPRRELEASLGSLHRDLFANSSCNYFANALNLASVETYPQSFITSND